MNSSPTALLIKPSSGREAAFPLDLAGLVPALLRAGWEVEGADVDFGEADPALRRALEGRYAAVVIGLESFQAPDAASLTRRLKALSPGTPVVVTGPQPTLFPEETLVETGADVALRGDGERLAAETLEALIGGGPLPEGTASHEDGQVERVGEPRWEQHLDELEPPDRHIVPLARYGRAYRSVLYPFAAMKSSRGCRCACPHCPVPALHPGGFTFRSAGLVADEMEQLARDHGVKDIHFEDHAFLTDRERVLELCGELSRRRRTPAWELVNGVRPEHVDSDLLADMARAGCRRIALGVEYFHTGPGTPATGLRHTPEDVRRITDAASRAGISTTGYFILGYPGNKAVDDEKLVDVSRELGFDMVHYSPYRDLAGSRLSLAGAVPEDGPTEVLHRVRRAYRSFYMRPGPMMYLARELIMEPRVTSAVVPKVLSELFGVESGIL